MSHDLLLEWVSERGVGSWEQFRRAHDWLFADEEFPRFMTSGFTMGILSTLGHAEIDWKAGRWAAAPPVLTLLPAAGAHALLTGGRTRTLMRTVERELAEDQYLYPLPPYEQEFAPSAVMIPCEDADHIEALAHRLGIRYEYSVSARLGAILPTLDDSLALARSAPPPRGFGFQRLDVTRLDWHDADSDEQPGLYRYEGFRGFVYQLLDADGLSYRLDLPTGIYAALRRWGQSRLRYEPASVNGELIVPLAAPLPWLHARTAALSSGLAPRREGRALVYVNVPEPIATRIARTLDQTLTIVGGGRVSATSPRPRP